MIGGVEMEKIVYVYIWRKKSTLKVEILSLFSSSLNISVNAIGKCIHLEGLKKI